MLDGLLDVLFPRRCAGCGAGVWPFCERCRGEVAPLAPPWCQRCGAPSGRDVRSCRHCPPPAVARARAAFLFEGPVRRAVHRLKFAGWRPVAEALGAAMARAWEGSPDAVAWVPLSRRRLADRGFDQARALAEQVARELGVPLVRLLRRVGDPGPQARRGGDARRLAMRGTFRAVGDVPRRVLVVDDVLTTGATAGACAEALRSAGAASVGVLTAARAVSGMGAASRAGPSEPAPSILASG
ncbi:MAG TPA: ComF family protein, partial [Actinomycetota bacterium]